MYALLADAVAILHALFILFVVGGLILILAGWARGWHWTRGVWFRWIHLAAITLVVADTWLGIWCPLTVLEQRWRMLAGEQGYAGGFVAYWMDRLVYYTAPDWVFLLIYTLFGLLVVLTFLLYPPRRTQS